MKRTRQTVYLQDCYNGEYNNIRIGDTIKIEYGYGHSETGKVYGKFATQWGKHLRVKIDNGNEDMQKIVDSNEKLVKGLRKDERIKSI